MKENSGASAVRQAAKRAAPRRAPMKTPSADLSVESGTTISVDERRALIAEAAYLRAESRGFAPGNEVEDWLQAEMDVDQRLLQR